MIRVHLVDPAVLPIGVRSAALEDSAGAVLVIRDDVSVLEIVESINNLGRNMRRGPACG